MSRAARAPPTAPPRHVSDHHALVPRTPLRRTCLCRIYTFTCACLTGPAGAAAAVDGCRPGHRRGCRMLRRRLGGAGAVFVVPQLTGLATWGWLFRRLAALCTRDEPLSHSGPNGRLRCGREAAVPAEVADSAAHFTTQVHARTCRFTLDLRPSHLEVHARAGLSLRTMAAGDEPLELATCRRVVENHPVLAAAEPRLGRQPATRSPRRPRPEAPSRSSSRSCMAALWAPE